jgi:hypothetical protein
MKADESHLYMSCSLLLQCVERHPMLRHVCWRSSAPACSHSLLRCAHGRTSQRHPSPQAIYHICQRKALHAFYVSTSAWGHALLCNRHPEPHIHDVTLRNPLRSLFEVSSIIHRVECIASPFFEFTSPENNGVSKREVSWRSAGA